MQSKRFVIVILTALVSLFLSGCGLLNNDKCCCVTTGKFFQCSDKKAWNACAVPMTPGQGVDGRDDYNSCKDSALLLPSPLQLRDATIVLVQSNGPSTPKVVEVPAEAYAATASGVKAKLDKAYNDHATTSIATLLAQVPWGAVNTSSIKEFIDRGSLLFTGNTVKNDGNDIDVVFQDERLGSIEISVPGHVEATVTRAGSSTKFSFKQPAIVILQGLASKYQIPSNQRLDSVAFGSDSMSYEFHAAVTASERLTILVKLSPKNASHALLENPAREPDKVVSNSGDKR
jgi:hypothetical protein